MQRTWAYLESIFMGSEDIRIQLPEDVQRFDNVDKEFKSMMVEMAQTPNVVKATNVETLPDALQDLQNNLIKCEKALAEYLDTKRLAFPRCTLKVVPILTLFEGSTLPPPLTCLTFSPTATIHPKLPST